MFRTITMKILPSLLLTLTLSTSSLYANEADNVSMIVLDASGSMWKQLNDGRTKIEIARSVLGDYLKNRNNTIPLGVIAYGHRRKGDCADIELISPAKTQNIATLTKKINGITPKGKTPLTDALALAIKQIPRTAEEADIILITDGLETCDKDPCALAKKIADEGINIRAHVVGFGLTEKEINRLSCIPQKTGGQLLRPQSGKELTEALKTVEETIEKKPTEQSSLFSIHISMHYKEGAARPTSVTYSAKNTTTNEVIELSKTDDTAEIVRGFNTQLPTGTWLLIAQGPQGRGEIEITPKNGESYQIPYQAEDAPFSMKNYGPYQLGQGQSFLIALAKPMQKNLTLRAKLYPADATDKTKAIDNEYLIGLGAGIHEVNFKSPKAAGKYQVVITPNGLKEAIASFDIDYVGNAETTIKIPQQVKPNEKFSYALYGNWYRNNALQIVQNGKKISDTWLQKSIEKKGLFLTAPNKAGVYDILFRHKDSTGKNTVITLAKLQVKAPSDTTNTTESNAQDQTEKQAQRDKYLAPAVSLHGDWSLSDLNIDGDKPIFLLETHIIHNLNEETAQSDIVLPNSSTLGTALKGERFHVSNIKLDHYQTASITLAFKTSKGSYSAKLKYTPIRYDEREESWGGELLLEGKPVINVLFSRGKSVLEHAYQGEHSAEEAAAIREEEQKTPMNTGLFDLKKDSNLLVFTCKEKVCTYDDKDTGLNDIPLLKDWALTEPFYHATAGAGAAKNPSIVFVNTTNGQWIDLNPRMLDLTYSSCIEFGKNGRLSAEERICYSTANVNNENNQSGDMMTLLENIETWRDTFYQSQASKSMDSSSKITETDEQLKASLFSNGDAIK